MKRLMRMFWFFSSMTFCFYAPSLVLADCLNCRENLNYPTGEIFDPSGDQGTAEFDITYVELMQVSEETLQLKINVFGDPSNLMNHAADIPQYVTYFDINDDGTTDFRVRIGYDSSPTVRMRASVESDKEGTMELLPFLLRDHSVYIPVSITPYRDSYELGVGDTIKFTVEVKANGETKDAVGDGMLGPLQSGLTDPGFRIEAENEIFANSPHSMYLDYDSIPYNLSVSVSASEFLDCKNNVEYFSTFGDYSICSDNLTLIAEIVNGNQVKTNYDTMTSVDKADKAYISAYLPDCDLLVDDFILALSGKVLLKHGKAAYVVPTQRYAEDPPHWVQISDILVQYDAARISNLALDVEEDLVGKTPYDGVNRIFGYNYPITGALAGQPIWFNTCVLIHCDLDIPHWGTHYHEVGHPMTKHIFSNSANSRFAGFRNRGDVTNGNRYSEGMATLNGMYTIRKLIQNREQYNISQEIVNSLQVFEDQQINFHDSRDCEYDSGNSICNYNEVCDYGMGENWRYCEDCKCFTSLWAYENLPEFNSEYINIDPNILDGMFFHLAEYEPALNPCGWEIYPRFYRVFLLGFWDIDTQIVGEEEGEAETFFVAALSAAAITSGGSDLRSLFEGWGFNINADYNTIRMDLENKLNSIPPTLSSSPSSFSFSTYEGGPAPDCQTLYIRNKQAGGTLNWSASDDRSWLSLNPASGLSTCETDEVAVCVNPSGLSADTYSGTITISSNGGNTTIPVNLTISASAITVISPNGGEIWGMSEWHTIQWDPGYIADTVMIQYKPGFIWKPIVSNIANLGTYDWYINDNSADCSNTVKVRIIPNEGSSDESNGYFTIDCYPYLELIEPEVNGRTLTQNGVTFPRCGVIDTNWCSANTCGAIPNNGPFKFSWGDGKTSCSSFPCSHTYSSPGTYNIIVNVANTCGYVAQRSNRCDICHGHQEDGVSRFVAEKTIQVTIH